MKKITTTIMKNGKSREISINVDDETAKLLLENCNETIIHEYIVYEYESRNIERKETRRHTSIENLNKHGFEIKSVYPSPMEISENEELKKTLFLAINKLTHDQQEVVRLFYFENKTQSEIAKMRGVHKTAVNKQLQRAINQLRKILKNY